MHNVPATIYRLPCEILAEIFLYGRDSQASPRWIVHYLASVSEVCSLWRSAAVTTALLWTSVYYNFPTRQLSTITYARLSAYLERSKNASIDVSMVFAAEDANAARIWELIRPHMGRCRYAKLMCPTIALVRMILPLPGRLERLTHFEWGTPPEMGNSFDAANASPLQSLTIFGPVNNSSLGAMFSEVLSPVSFGRAPNCNWPEVIKFLERCPVVKSIRVGFCQQNGPFRDEAPLTVHTITDLSIVDHFPFSFHHFIATPKLRNLTIKGDGGLITSAHKVSQPSWPRLETARIEHTIFCAPDTLVPFFEANENINSLSVISCGQHISVLLILLMGPMNHSINADIHLKPPEKGPLFLRNDLLPFLRTLRFQNCRSGYRSGQVGPSLIALLGRRPHLHIECDLRSMECTEFEVAGLTSCYGRRFTILEE